MIPMANNISFAVLPKSPILKRKPLVNNVYIMDAIVFLCRPNFLYLYQKKYIYLPAIEHNVL